MTDEPNVFCNNCTRPFPVWNIHEKKIECPYCGAKGDNPHYVKPEKIDPKKVFVMMEE